MKREKIGMPERKGVLPDPQRREIIKGKSSSTVTSRTRRKEGRGLKSSKKGKTRRGRFSARRGARADIRRKNKESSGDNGESREKSAIIGHLCQWGEDETEGGGTTKGRLGRKERGRASKADG